MSFIKVYIHFVWSTKNWDPILKTKELRKKVWQHIRENAIEKGIFIDFINGFSQHCHCLISLGGDQTIQKIMQLIKGESAHWINKIQLTETQFEWQNDFWAASVSPSGLDRVREYIKNQEDHHSRRTFKEEIDEFIEKYGFEKYKD